MRGAAVLLSSLLAVSVLPTTALAALPTTSTPALTLSRTIRTTPFAGTTISTRDAEGTAYVPRDKSLYLVGDNGRAVFEIDPYTGTLKRVLAKDVFEAASKLGGGAAAGPTRTGDFESLAYDEDSDTLYAFSGTCCSSTALPTVFRLTRDVATQRLRVDSYQPLPSGTDYTGAAWSPLDDAVYVGKGGQLRAYDYVTNTSGPAFGIRGVSGILGLDFTADGRDLLVVTSGERLFRINWNTRTVVMGWNLDLTPFGVRDSRGVEVIPHPSTPATDQIYVYDGYEGRPSGDPLRYAVFVFDVSVGGGGEEPGELVRNPGFESDTAGWADDGVATLSRVAGGHDSAFAARLFNAGTTSGNCVLNDRPNWVTSALASTYTGSIWVRADVGGGTLKLRFREYAGSSLVKTTASTVALTTTWQRVAVAITPTAGNSLDLTALTANAPPGTCFFADDASITT